MGDKEQEACSTGLGLGIGVGEFVPKSCGRPKRKQVACLDLSFPLYPKEEAVDACCKTEGSSSKLDEAKHGIANNNNCDSNTINDRNSSSSNNNNNCSGKKLRLSKEQSTLLEETFKLHSTLNPIQKQKLAEMLNLQPRQVEVWFQNRRARTKLKQTEVNCGFLKKFCESLSDENRRLKKELQELRLLKFQHHSPPHPPPFYIQLGNATTLSTCPSCEKFGKIGRHPTSVAPADASANSNAKNDNKEREEAAVVMDLVCKKESGSGSSSSDKQLEVSFS